MPARFVILHHRLDGGEHWDLMLEHREVLLTWQLLCEPVDAASLPLPARRIGDHRKAYLEYEGPVSGGRGTVRRVDAGTLEIEKASENRLQFRLGGSRLRGSFVLQRVEAPEWTLANLPVP